MRLAILALLCSFVLQGAWKRHTIDNASQGADGVRLADINGDGLQDIVTGWEEGGVVRVYLNPGPKQTRQPWPNVTVGEVASPEDAVFVDLDGDGASDVVSSSEGSEQAIHVHWGPSRDRILDPKAWTTGRLPAAHLVMQWMFALPVDIDGLHGIDLVAGGKNRNAQVGWFASPPNPRDLAAWRWFPMTPVGWIMSIEAHDMDGDGDLDLLISDRKGERSGVFWLDNPGKDSPALHQPWTRRPVGALGEEVMFLTTADLDGDGLVDVISTAKPDWIYFHRRRNRGGLAWQNYRIRLPEGVGTVKAVRVADIDLDGKPDLIFSCEQAKGDLSGVMWLSYADSPVEQQWRPHEISGPEGVKYDLIELVDLDGDGDLDVITCEETTGLGVVWYENPAR
ncbi:MAG: VCBS repeat-containing protein [Bryobacterales bacterium]|nr:VCBS repeat-containing protein [Bryobacterales bacterium]